MFCLEPDTRFTWIVKRLKPGKRIIAEINSAIADSRRCITLLSNHYHTSEWTKYECNFALREGPKIGEGNLVPIMILEHEVPSESWFYGTNHLKLFRYLEEEAKEELLSKLAMEGEFLTDGSNNLAPPPFPGLKTRKESRPTNGRSAKEFRRNWEQRIQEEIDEIELKRDQEFESGENLRKYEEELAGRREELERGPPLQKGVTLYDNRFHLVQQIGEGLHGTVWRALDRENSEWVALKILRGIHGDGSEVRTRFSIAAKTLGHMQHDGIIRLRQGPLVDDRFCFVVMDHVEGGNLEKLFEKHSVGEPMSWSLAQCIAANVAATLRYMHEQEGIVHLDVRPSKLLISCDHRVKLTGFEQSRKLREVGPTSIRPVVLPGSPRAPEWEQGYLGEETDVWYLGQLTLRLLAISDARGDAAEFLGDDLESVLRNPTALIAESQLPNQVKELLERAVHEAPSDRNVTVGQFLNVFAPTIPFAAAEVLHNLDLSIVGQMSRREKARFRGRSNRSHVHGARI